MGVAGLWEVLRPAGQVRSLTELAVGAGFNANPSHQRGFRVGIDASIWFFHAAYGREGENPELRTLFFRCCRLLQSPLLPLFVFDGPNRPAIKRGKRVGGNAHWLTQGMKNIIEAFGFEWRVAPGEAEAELAYLNRIGIIDAVLSDDVDNFLFGATMVIRNPSNTLSGNRAHPVKNAQGKDDGNHIVTYTADAILSNPSVALSRSGTILIGLLSGGDYVPAGLPGCGQKFATGLARAGFGDSLMKAVKELKGARLDAFLDQWRQDIRNELRTNKSGLLPTKKPSLAASLPDDFPSLPVLMSYADPLTSENTPQRGNHKARLVAWRNDPDPMRIASICELYFEWGVKDIIVQRFRTVLWPGIVCRAVRRVVVDDDALRHPPRGETRRIGSEDNTTASPSSPTKQLSSTFSSITLSSPSKKSSVTSSSPSDPSASESFTLASLVTLISAHPESPLSSSSRASSPSSLLLGVVSQRTHASTDSTLEYRVLVDPTTLVERAESGVKGLRPPLIGGLFGIDPEDENEDGSTLDQDVDVDRSDDGDGVGRLETAAGAASKSSTKRRKARKVIPTTPLRLWLPACMVRAAAPALAAAYEEKVTVREEKKAKRGTKARRGRRAGTGGESMSREMKPKDNASEDDDQPGPHPSTSKTATRPKAKSKIVRVGVGRGRRKPKQASEAQNDEYECIDLSAGESPYSSDGESVNVNIKGKGKEKKKMAQTEGMNRKVTTTNTMNEYFNTSKPSTMRATMQKPSIPRPPAPKASASNPVVSRSLCEEDFVDVPPLPKSLRPLDLLRAKRKVGTTASNPTAKSKSNSTAVPRHEEEESSSSSPPIRPSGSKLNLSSLPSRPARLVPRPKQKPLFVDVSDADSDIEVSEVRRPPSSKAVAVEGDMCTSVGVGETYSTIAPGRTMGRAVGSVVYLAVKGNVSKSKSTPSTSMATVSPSLVSASSVDPTQTARSASKPSHIFLPQSPLESEEEGGSEEDELPMFHCPQSKAIKKDAVLRPVPRPFPMQLMSDSPVSLRASRLRETSPGHADEKDDGDVVEIVDVFTTPRGPSPPPSPTPTPSPVKLELAYASGGPPTFATRQSNVFPNSPTRHVSQVETEIHKKTKHRRHMPSEEDTPVSGNERNGILKSPRKSAAHSSPRHISRGDRRVSSPTPFVLSKPASSTSNTLWTGDMGRYNALDSRLPLEDSGGAGRKPRLSDTSAISISSGSEDDEGDAVPVTHNTRDVKEAGGDHVCTDEDVDTWADTGMILSVPPSPAAPAGDDLVPAVPVIAAVIPTRTSKFKPAHAVTSTVDMHAPSVDHRVSSSPQEAVSGEDTVVPRSMRRAPLLVARAKRSISKDNNVIDLTSD